MNKYTKRAERYWEDTHRLKDDEYWCGTCAEDTGTISFTSDTIVWSNA